MPKSILSATWIRCLLLASCWQLSSSAGYMDKNSYSSKGQVQKVRRERNLDHWDSDTLAYYLDDYPGFDIAIMFYAPWDSNSRTLAPYWDRMATQLDAGNSRSRLVMALFDCELNLAHSELCQAVGITHYPTLLFVGSGPYHDTDPLTKTLFGKRAAGIFGEAPVPNTVKFQGNWQYTDSIMDWIRTMQALSNWHSWNTKGFGKKLRNFFLPHRPDHNAPLPIGIPGNKRAAAAATATSTAPSGTTTDDSQKVQSLEKQITKLSQDNEKYEKIVHRSSTFLDALLTTGNNDNSTKDMFTLLHEQKAWTKSDQPIPEILRHCVEELSLDYCQRMSQKAANDMVDELAAQGMTVDEMLALPNLEQEIIDRIGKAEPYCSLLDQCILNDFSTPECQPKTCPFQNTVACHYLTSCLDPSFQQEYADALGFTLKDDKPSSKEPPQQQQQKQQQKQEQKKQENDSKKKKKWGL